MSATGTARERGVTLLELLVVIALLGLLSAVGAQALMRASDPERHADRVERVLRHARQRARDHGEAVVLACGELYRSSAGAAAPGGSMPISCLREGRPAASITFYPDGSATGELVEIGTGAALARLSIDWLTGEVARE